MTRERDFPLSGWKDDIVQTVGTGFMRFVRYGHEWKLIVEAFIQNQT